MQKIKADINEGKSSCMPPVPSIDPSHGFPKARLDVWTADKGQGRGISSEPISTGYLEMQIRSRPNPKSCYDSCENIVKYDHHPEGGGHGRRCVPDKVARNHDPIGDSTVVL